MPSSDRELRLLAVLDQVRPTGLVRQSLELLDGVRSRGVEPRVLCLVRAGTDLRPLADRLAARGLSHDVVRERRAFDLRTLPAVRRAIAAHQPDILQTHGYKAAVHAMLLPKRRRPPWVAFYHGRTTTDLKVRFYHLLERHALSRATEVVTVADGVRDHLRPRDRARVRIVPNGVVRLAEPARSRREVRRDLGIGEDDVVLGFVGRLSAEKGPDIFVRTLRRLSDGRDDVFGLVVGDGPMREELEAYARTNVPDRTHFTGRVDDVAEMYAAMDVLVLSSRSEVFPNVLLEGVMARVPVVATAVGGVPGVAASIPTVHVVDEVEPDVLAGRVERALAPSAEDLSAAVRLVQARFGQDRRAEAAMAVYEAAVGGDPRRTESINPS